MTMMIKEKTPECLRSLSDEELANRTLLSEEEIRKALDDGWAARLKAAEQMWPSPLANIFFR